MGVLVVTASITTARLAPGVGSHPLVPSGMLLAAVGMLLLSRLGLHSTYSSGVLPALLPLGLGLGLIFAPPHARHELADPGLRRGQRLRHGVPVGRRHLRARRSPDGPILPGGAPELAVEPEVSFAH